MQSSINNKKKVCFVTHDHSFFKKYLMNLAVEISETYNVTVITDAQNVTHKDLTLLREHNISLEGLKQRSKTNRLQIVKYIYELKKIVNNVAPEYIFYTTIEIAFFGSLITRFKTSRKSYFVITGIGLDFFSNRLRYKILNLIYFIIFKANRFKENASYIFQNQEDQHLFLKAGYTSPNNSTVIGHFGITLANPDDAQKKSTDFIKFFFAGRLVKSKGIIELIEATQYLEKKYSNFQTIIAGPESLDSGDPLTVSELKLLETSSFIKYIGHIDYEDMYSLYQKFDVFVLPSYREGLSTVALEASANGMPLIISDVPGCSECFNDNGFLIKVKDSSDLANAMEKFILNPNLIYGFSKNSYEHIRLNYSSKKMAHAYLDLMNKD
jgi:glycosyltransferase involved in cell wall biosynthesis